MTREVHRLVGQLPSLTPDQKELLREIAARSRAIDADIQRLREIHRATLRLRSNLIKGENW